MEIWRIGDLFVFLQSKTSRYGKDCWYKRDNYYDE